MNNAKLIMKNKVIMNEMKWNEAISSIKLLIIFLLFSTASFAAVSEDFTIANKLYSEKKYEEAIKQYESIITADNQSTDIYYNLGNAYYKTNNIPSAILNYERALKLQPDNEDALFNLAMVNKLTVDKIDRLPELFIENSWSNLITSRTVDNWAYSCIGLLFLSLLFFVGYLITRIVIIKKTNFYAGVLFFGLSMFCFLLAFQHNKIIKESSEAIIFISTTTIQSEPNENSEKLFTLHEGTKVKLLEESNAWSKIKLPNGNVGWIASKEIKNI
ncbi:MAG: hypothetical protein COX70_06595 [Flavobacteriales bacterium CG_4_10_14_0_2_um_filter_32_8]|nr:MAG: hypothetical protein COX70_06595 [Flavobacteriales bacterium CG_4_10_14_0_2_um_filter_32_8]PJB15435.1 MAG: hypothetical protein CO118_03450 [Flavobacteriales bacterium CG_4_9_14_3_um_filter_32_8]